ncbi:MAG: HAMP domain-containing protein [Deltaproteobacteria bacterium]|nr:MAG: HAMP domain-containing protein [Deltaproteobacteria bacterium]
MVGRIFRIVNNLQIRWKMLVVVLPLVVIPIVVIGALIGFVASRQATLGITTTSRADLDHMAGFTLDLLDAHDRQFKTYQADKEQTVRQDLKVMVDLAANLVKAEQRKVESGVLTPDSARSGVGRALADVHLGPSGYLFVLESSGRLAVHPSRAGDNILDEQDEAGRFFIRDLVSRAVKLGPGEVDYIVYPWRNPGRGERQPRMKIAAFSYFPPWDWIIAAGSYLDEGYRDARYERRSFAELKEKIKRKKVGRTGYIYCMDRMGNLLIHPDAEGENIYDRVDSSGRAFIRKMCETKEGWIRYPWRNEGEKKARMKIVRYRYFEPWDWIVAVGSYEDEFYAEANLIKWRIMQSIFLVPLVVGCIAVAMVFLAAKVLTDPIRHMTAVIRRVKRGRFDARMQVDSRDELGELAATFNRMTSIIQAHKELEANLAQQGKMASIGVLSSGVAHEINNPLGVILGYAGYLEGKVPEEDPNHRFIVEIKRESKRCKKIVQDLLSFARTPRPDLGLLDLNALLDEIIDFASNHTELHHVRIRKKFDPALPNIEADGDQLRQVAINLLLNAGAAVSRGGVVEVRTGLEEDMAVISIWDNGSGISEEHLEKIFEPFFTTRARGTGLGLAITRQIIDQHHGQISIDSEPGVGTTVTVLLPLCQEGVAP